jgi:hypothetical protein
VFCLTKIELAFYLGKLWKVAAPKYKYTGGGELCFRFGQAISVTTSIHGCQETKKEVESSIKRAVSVHEAPALRGIQRRVRSLGIFIRSHSLQFLQEPVSTT